MSILIPTPAPSAPYIIVNDALNLARVRINDAIVSIGGDMLTNVQPFTQVMTNAAWLKMQQYLAQLGYSRSRKRTVLTGFPVVGSTDPASETRLDWSTYYDGVSYFIPPNVQVLPPDFLAPMRIGERQSQGFQPTLTTGSSGFRPVTLARDGNVNWRKKPWNGWFDWRDDFIVMPGATAMFDLEIFYAAYLGDFLTVGEVPWYSQPVPIMRSLSALANYIAAEFSGPRGDLDAQQFVTDAQMDCRAIYNNTDVPLRQRNNISRRSYSGRGGGSSGYGFGY
jgi:hypothetical protein